MFGIESLIIFMTLVFFIYKYLTRNFDYWKNRNVSYSKPVPFFGNYYEIMTFRTTIAHYLAKLYSKFKTPYFGIFVLNRPTLVIRDHELIKAILVKDFNHFSDHAVLSDKNCDSIFSNMLFAVKNPEWKMLRSKMTPAFTSGKIKGMLGLINEVNLQMMDYIKKYSTRNDIELKELCAKYSTDVIATCAFGINAHCFEDENAEFRVIGRRMFDFQWGTAFRQLSYFMVPELVKLLKLTFFQSGVNEFFRDVFWKTIRIREETLCVRNDLIDILIQMRKQSDRSMDFSGDRLVAQASMFFLAGFEPVSGTMAFALYELSLSAEIQNKARSEIQEVISKYGGLTHEAVQDLKYLHMVICETLRKYPNLPFIDRICVEDYKLPGSDLVIEKDTPVYIPMFGLHYDPAVYPEPEKFDPERFSEENRKSLPSFSFLPFGEGPRSCIGERFALLATKMGLAHVLLEYRLEKSSNTPVPVEFQLKSLPLAAKSGLPIIFKKLTLNAA